MTERNHPMKKPISILICAILLLALCPFIPANAEDTIVVEQIKTGLLGGNCYILSQGGSAVLVDTGTAQYRDAILQKCREKNVGLIVITHGHYDHTQNAAFLAEALGVPIAMHPADIPLLTDLHAEPALAHKLLGKLLVWTMKLQQKPVIGPLLSKAMNNEIPPFTPDIALDDGFSLEPYGIAAAVTALPGHTRGCVGVLAGKNLFAGDALMNMGRPGPALHYVDRAAMENSAAKITALGEDVTVWFGHGNQVKNQAW